MAASYSRKEQIGECTLYLGDSREILLDLDPCDTMMTDPVWPNVPLMPQGWEFLQGGNRPYELFEEIIAALPEARRLVIIMRSDSDPRFLARVPDKWPFFNASLLMYVMPGYIGRKLGGTEIAYCFGEPIPSGPGQRCIPTFSPKIQPDGRQANGHPCSRAVSHMEWLVRWWSEPADTVLDPYMGSGTTGVACVKLGRKFVGIEIEEKYFDIACKRVEDAYRQGNLFTQRAPIIQLQEALL